MTLTTDQTERKSTVDEIVDYTAELPLVWQEKILWMAKGMKYTRENMNGKKKVVEKNTKWDIV